MISRIIIEDFLTKADKLPVIDVRSPIEFNRGHIPGAINISLFTDEERAIIGKLYHSKGNLEAVNLGLEMVSPKLSSLVEKVKEAAPAKSVLLHCWRGGIRSESFAFLLKLAGFDVELLEGGYKSYRRIVTSSFEKKAKIIVIGGMTGSGKTIYLKQLTNIGLQTIDLEALADHKGSVFGAIGQAQQGTSEQFENNLFQEWYKLDFNKSIILEDENLDIGNVKLPVPLYRQIRNAPLIQLLVPMEIRASQLVSEYCGDDQELINCIKRIERRLGNEQMNLAIESVLKKNYHKTANILLVYYDKSYISSINKRNISQIFSLDILDDNTKKTIQNINALIQQIETYSN